jgi:acetyl esterase/lipase
VAAAAALETGDARLDFAAPVYPAVPKELNPGAGAPPLFIALAHDDFLDPVENGIRLYTAWKKAKAQAEIHIYAKGGHGFGMRKSGAPTDAWLDAFAAWLRGQSLIS